MKVVFLSGGLDSSLITAIASKNSNNKVKTFSVGYAKSNKETEFSYARSVAKHYKTDHTEIKIDFKNYDLENIIDELFTYVDRPIADPAILPSFIMSREVSKHVKVVLNGGGGDEVFSGYPKNIEFNNISKYFLLPKFVRKVFSMAPEKFIGPQRKFYLSALSKNVEDAFLYRAGCFHPEILNKYYVDKKRVLKNKYYNNSANVLKSYFTEDPILKNVQNFDVLSYMPDDTLPKIDFSTMAASIEARSPFLDHTLAEFAFSIPFNQRLYHNTNKYIIKRIAEKYLSSDIIYRKKQGFSVPLQSWFNNDLNEYINDTLLSRDSFISKYTNKKIVEKLIGDNKKIDYSNHLWVLLTLEKWGRNYG